MVAYVDLISKLIHIFVIIVYRLILDNIVMKLTVPMVRAQLSVIIIWILSVYVYVEREIQRARLIVLTEHDSVE